jgi:hypothetical protein
MMGKDLLQAFESKASHGISKIKFQIEVAAFIKVFLTN